MFAGEEVTYSGTRDGSGSDAHWSSKIGFGVPREPCLTIATHALAWVWIPSSISCYFEDAAKDAASAGGSWASAPFCIPQVGRLLRH